MALRRGSDGELAVHELADGDGDRIPEGGTDLLLVHATGLHGRVWAPLVPHLAASLGARALALDLRGHGESAGSASWPAGGMAWSDLATDILDVVDGLQMRHPIAVGHSSGASLLLLAEELRPGTFAGLYCIEPIGTAEEEPPPPDPAHPLADGARRRRQVFPSHQAAFDAYRGKPPFSLVAPEALWAYVEHGFEEVGGGGGEVRLRCRPETEADMYTHGLSHTAYRDLSKVGCPVTLARGGESQAVRAGALDLWSTRLLDARLEVLPGLGHFAPLEDPAAVARSVAAAFEPV
ncbi:MAG TPA: alpha/beta hydrolase [Acidimicrobiales bacterium]|nr:alpha/beta hydrolase [Acidimicrobiales bacterium]